jgi:hypothetical protein
VFQQQNLAEILREVDKKMTSRNAMPLPTTKKVDIGGTGRFDNGQKVNHKS